MAATSVTKLPGRRGGSRGTDVPAPARPGPGRRDLRDDSYGTVIGSSQAPYRNGSTAVFITWDEGEGGGYRSGERCATSTTDVSCHVAILVISPSTRAGTRSATLFNHYSLPGTAEQLLGLPKLGLAASYPTMTRAFNL